MKNKKFIVGMVISTVTLSSIFPINKSYGEEIKSDRQKQVQEQVETLSPKEENFLPSTNENLTEASIKEEDNKNELDKNTIDKKTTSDEEESTSPKFHFESHDFRKLIVDLLNKNHGLNENFETYEPTVEDMQKLKSFNISWMPEGVDGNNITSLKGLEHAINIEEFSGSSFSGPHFPELKDFSPLASLKNLKSLDLGNCKISNIDFISDLTNLEKLILSYNDINDISPLGSLKNLNYLEIEKNKLTDVSPLASLKNLEHITIRGNYVSDASPFKDLTELTYLHLYENRIDDISMLGNLTKLKEFNISKNQIKDISVIENYLNMRVFQARQNQIEDIEPIINTLQNNKVLGFDTDKIVDGILVTGVINLSENNIKNIKALKSISTTDLSPIGEKRNIIMDNQKTYVDLKLEDFEQTDGKYRLSIKNPLQFSEDVYGQLIKTTSDFDFEYSQDGSDLTLVVDPSLVNETPANLYSQFKYDTILENCSEYPLYSGDLIFRINPEKDNNVYQEVEFFNDNLREYINSSLNLDPFRFNGNPFNHDPKTYHPIKNDMVAIKSIYTSSFEEFNYMDNFEKINKLGTMTLDDVKTLKGLEQALYMEKLIFDTGYLEDISSLKNLKRLKYLDLSNNKNLDDIKTISALRQLETIKLANMNLKDISFLKDLPFLRTLDISGNEIDNIKGLENLSQVEILNLAKTNISNLENIKSFIKIRDLNLASNKIDDLSSFLSSVNLQSLKALNLEDNSFDSIEALLKFTDLENLSLASTKLEASQFPHLKQLKNLQSLNLSDSSFYNFNSIDTLNNIKDLNLADTQVSDLSKLYKFKNIEKLNIENTAVEKLNLSNTAIESIIGLENPSLKDLNLEGFSAYRVPDLNKLTNLENLNLSKVGQISDLENFKDLNKLKSLNLSNNSMYNFRGIENFKNLEVLKVENSNVKKLDLIGKLDSLKVLDLSNNKRLKDFSQLKNLTNLESINLSNTKITDLSILKDLANLKEVNVSNCKISNVNGLRDSIKIIGLAEKSKPNLDPGRPIEQEEDTGKNDDRDKPEEKIEILLTDLKSNHWAKKHIDNLLSKNILKGYVDNTFKANNPMTRGEFAAVLDRLFQFEDSKVISHNGFKDVKKNSWFYKTIQKFKNLGLIKGEKGSFNPNRPISREEMIKMLVDAIEKDGRISLTKNKADFTDSDSISKWAYEPMEKILSLDLIDGYPDKSLKPKQYISRAEIAKIIDRLLSHLQ